MVHSAVWPKDIDLKDKRVAVIGVGSTAVQIIPNIEPRACSDRDGAAHRSQSSRA